MERLPERTQTQSDRYHENIGTDPDFKTPCIICGKLIENESPTAAWLHVHGGGVLVVTHEEAKSMDEAADLGWWPIGDNCLRRHPKLKPYAERGLFENKVGEPTYDNRIL